MNRLFCQCLVSHIIFTGLNVYFYSFFYVKRQCYAYVNFLYYFGLIICILLVIFVTFRVGTKHVSKVNLYN